MAGDKRIRHRGRRSPDASSATRVQARKGFGMYVLVIVVGFITAGIGLGFMLENLPGHREVPALWAIVAALGVLQICFGAIGNTLASLVRTKLPSALETTTCRVEAVKRRPKPLDPDNPLDADADLFDKTDDKRETSES